MEELINKFLQVSSGDGYGYGYGSGSGDGYGSGSGDGSCSGSGDGSGYGYGDGYGYGYGYGSGYGYGYGDGSCSGSGDGYGSGDGSCSGSGDGSGYGYGYGYGSGDGYGVKTFNGQRVYKVDGVQTLIDAIHGNYAKGRILKSDLTTEPCFIARVGDCFAHGETLKKAQADAQEKYMRSIPLDERIAQFKQAYPTLDTPCKGADLFRWHNTLTGSCEFGRKAFCNEHGLDPDKVTMTVSDFIELTKNAYGSNAIEQLREAYN